MILGALDIKYMSRTSVKGHIFTNLMAEFAETPLEERVKEQNIDEKSIGAISL